MHEQTLAALSCQGWLVWDFISAVYISISCTVRLSSSVSAQPHALHDTVQHQTHRAASPSYIGTPGIALQSSRVMHACWSQDGDAILALRSYMLHSQPQRQYTLTKPLCSACITATTGARPKILAIKSDIRPSSWDANNIQCPDHKTNIALRKGQVGSAPNCST